MSQPEQLTEIEGTDFSFDMQKKKKKKVVRTETLPTESAYGISEFEQELKDGDENTGEPSSSSIKPTNFVIALDENDADRPFTYNEMLNRIYADMKTDDPAHDAKTRTYTMIPPNVARDGTKKTNFANIMTICKKMHRPHEHLTSFLLAELATTGSLDGNQSLIIKGRFQQSQIESVLKKYILEYVVCKTCKAPETDLNKENRLTFLVCQRCGSKRSVNPIKAGFSAQVGKRKADQ